MTTKQCRLCGEVKELKEFNNIVNTEYYLSTCRSCRKIETALYRYKQTGIYGKCLTKRLNVRRLYHIQSLIHFNQVNGIRKDENLLLSMRDIIAMKIKNN